MIGSMRDSMRLVGMRKKSMPLSCCPALAHLTLAREHRAHVKALEEACSVSMGPEGPQGVLNHTGLKMYPSDKNSAKSNIRRVAQ